MDTKSSQLAHNQDERSIAALAHASVIFPYLGAIVPLIIWATRKDKNSTVALHALQALIYQICIILLWSIGFLCYFAIFIGNLISVIQKYSIPGDAESINWSSSLMPLVWLGIITFLGFTYIVYGITGAVMTFQGKQFRYAVIGKWTEQFLRTRRG